MSAHGLSIAILAMSLLSIPLFGWPLWRSLRAKREQALIDQQ